MAQYQVLKPIEKNCVHYVPKGHKGPKTVLSMSHGKPIPVDASGTIELTDDEALEMTGGQIPMVKGRPEAYWRIRDKRVAEEAAEAKAIADAEAAEKEEFEQWKAAKTKAAKKK
jgi:hypothetical protein